MNTRLSFALATALTLACTAFAHANTYDLGVIADDTTFTSDTVNHPTSGSYQDFFDFQVESPLSEYTSAAFTEAAPFGINSADLTLYTSSGDILATSGVFDPQTSKVPTISYDSLNTGSYYIEADVTVPSGDRGSYTVTATTVTSAAPEPTAWALTTLGVGVMGYALRRKPKLLRAMAA